MSDERTASNLLPIGDEFAGIDLGDARLDVRAERIAELIAASPALSFPQIAGSDGQLEAFYRFFNNARVSVDDLLEPHFDASARRAAASGEQILVVADTTTVRAPAGTDPKTFGKLPTGKAGFFAHLSMLVGLESGRVFGVCGYETWRRLTARPSSRMSGPELAKLPDRESKRWVRQSDQVAATLEGYVDDAIRVMDREADIYEVFELVSRFVVRSRNDRLARKICGKDWSRISVQLKKIKVVVSREVPISRRVAKRAPVARKTHPPRCARVAKLEISAQALEIKKPRYLKGAPTVSVNFVVVREKSPPKGEVPISWLLMTNEPIATEEDLVRVVDIYRRRWLIEELFKSIKTGCAYNERQFGTYEAMDRVFAMTIPVAWRLLAIRSLSRDEPELPAAIAFTPDELDALRHRGSRKLSASPTVREALHVIAGIGGHLKSNGDPGWRVLYRGFVEYLSFAAGWTAAIAANSAARIEKM